VRVGVGGAIAKKAKMRPSLTPFSLLLIRCKAILLLSVCVMCMSWYELLQTPATLKFQSFVRLLQFGGGQEMAVANARSEPVAEGRKSDRTVQRKQHGRQPSDHMPHVQFEQRPSMLSSEHPDNSYRGFVNVIIILLIMANIRIVIQNLLKYGVLVQPSNILYLAKVPNVVLTVSIWLYIFLAYAIEMLHGVVPAKVFFSLHWMNAAAAFFGPWYGIWCLQTDPGGGIIALTFAATAFMKITSFFLMCEQLREEYAAKDKHFKATLNQWLYFVATPTLVFRESYPRTKVIRWGWLLRRVFEFVGLWAGIFIVATQYVVPSVDNTFRPMANGNVLLILEGLLKICVPNFIIWLLGFYAIFHVYLNILAELTRFGDRQFYRDWWNSTTLGYFWRSWNLPVHGWMVAHVYLPLTRRGWRKSTASLLIFLISALMHELVVSIPFWNFKLLAFGGMMWQVPLIEITKPLKGTQTGNVIFWLTIMLGQPMIVLLYARDYQTGMCECLSLHLSPLSTPLSSLYTSLLSLHLSPLSTPLSMPACLP
jgi:diacylglycerol O-acyltransferase-1